MNITLNGLTNPSSLLTFTDVHNILKVSENISGTKAHFTFEFIGNLASTVTGDSQYYVTFLGETVSNVVSPQNSNNKRFYISDIDTTAANFARALRNCGTLMAEFNIIHSGNQVTLLAKTIGQKWSNVSNYFTTNIPLANLNAQGTDGTSYSSLYGAKVDVDVYSGASYNNSNYVTTLEKNFYGNECAFDVSPVLSTFSEYGKTIPYSLALSLITADGEWVELNGVTANTTYGYLANQSDKYKYINNVQMLINTNREQIRYVYGDTIPFSFLWADGVSGFTVTVEYLDSAYNVIHTATVQYSTSGYDSHIVDTSISIPSEYSASTYYVDIIISNMTYRFNVIKPLKAADDYQRVFWRGEYGQVSFADFTGEKKINDTFEVETFEKSIYSYYDSNVSERKGIYSNKHTKTYTLKTHLMEERGTYDFYSLMRSKSVWMIDGDKTIYLIPKSIEVNEDQNYDGIFTVTCVFEFSDDDNS